MELKPELLLHLELKPGSLWDGNPVSEQMHLGAYVIKCSSVQKKGALLKETISEGTQVTAQFYVELGMPNPIDSNWLAHPTIQKAWAMSWIQNTTKVINLSTVTG